MDDLLVLLDAAVPYAAVVATLSAGVAAALHAVLRKRDTRAAISWVLLILLLPLLGAVLYASFGVNRIRRRARALGLRHTHVAEREAPCHVRPDAVGAALSRPEFERLARLVDRVSHFPLMGGNAVEFLEGGDAAFPAMIAAIDRAERSVALSSYIFDDDRAGRPFVAALERATARGVATRVLVDGIGVRYSKTPVTALLAKARVPHALFRPKPFPFALPLVNLRNHRKILVVDGRIGFTGGMNIREGALLSLSPRHPMRDLHARVEGPVVSQLAEAFADDWMFATDETLSGDAWFPPPAVRGGVVARAVTSGPDEDFETIRLSLLGAIASARRSVRIVTPYFLPDASLLTALNVAALQGVDVEIVLPARNNLPFVHWAMMATIWQVLERGCRVFLTPPPFDHTKLTVVDGVWTHFGSANWDSRSLRLNFEFDVECYDKGIAAEASRLVDERLASGRPLTLEEADSRNVAVRLRDGVARLFSPYL